MPKMCPACAALVPDGLTRCPQCGADIQNFMQAQPGEYQGYTAQPGGAYQPQGRRARYRSGGSICPECGRVVPGGMKCICGAPAPGTGEQPLPQPGMPVQTAEAAQARANNFQYSGTHPVVNDRLMKTGMYQVKPGFGERLRHMDWADLLTLQGIGRQFDKVRQRMGFADLTLDEQTAYERQRPIVPDCVAPGEGEIPLRQYEVCTLRRRLLGVTCASAEGRVQMTNQRVIFRASGRSSTELTCVQQEVSIQDIGMVQADTGCRIQRGPLLRGLVLMLLIALGLFLVLGSVSVLGRNIAIAVLCLTGLLVFLLAHKRWLLKTLLCGGVGAGSIAACVSGQGVAVWGVVVGAVCLALGVVALCMYALRAQVSLRMLTHQGNTAIEIVCQGGGKKSGYTEATEGRDASRLIREAAAIIHDVQKMGDEAVAKWVM